jgi:hypothetical protein
MSTLELIGVMMLRSVVVPLVPAETKQTAFIILRAVGTVVGIGAVQVAAWEAVRDLASN